MLNLCMNMEANSRSFSLNQKVYGLVSFVPSYSISPTSTIKMIMGSANLKLNKSRFLDNFNLTIMQENEVCQDMQLIQNFESDQKCMKEILSLQANIKRPIEDLNNKHGQLRRISVLINYVLVENICNQEVSKMFSRLKTKISRSKSKDIKIQDHKHAKGTSKEFLRTEGSKIQDVTKSEAIIAMTTP
ncbi:hypothetical protein Tco_0461385 [Tanacetum coccineum]